MIRRLIVAALLSVTAANAANWYVRKDGNDACVGTTDAAGSSGACAKLTIQAAVTAMSGSDVVTIHTGTYAECIVGEAKNGTATAPTTIQGATAETITIDSTSATCTSQIITAGSGVCVGPSGGSTHVASIRIGSNYTVDQYWKIKNLTIIPPDDSVDYSHSGIMLLCTDHIKVDGITSTTQPTVTGPANGFGNALVEIQNQGGTYIGHTTVANSTMSSSSFAKQYQFVTVTGSYETTIYNNAVSTIYGGLVCQSGGVADEYILGNQVESNTAVCDGNNIIQNYNTTDIAGYYNLFRANSDYVMRSRGYTFSSQHPRWIWAANTHIGTGGTTAIDTGKDADNNATLGVVIRDNYFESYTKALNFQVTVCQAGGCVNGGQVVAGCNTTISNNAYVNMTGVSDGDSVCSYTDSNSISPGTTQINGSYCPSSGSATIVNAGNSLYPTPTGGTSVPDIGACENGAAAGGWVTPYTFTALETTTDTTPTLSWTGSTTSDVDLTVTDPTTILGGAAQAAYEIQVDSSLTFDSVGIDTPIWTSGRTTSATQSATVSPALTDSTTYYVRYRLDDNTTSTDGRGPWSIPMMFTVNSGAPPPPTGAQRRRIIRFGP